MSERVRQLETKGLAKLKTLTVLAHLADDCDDTPEPWVGMLKSHWAHNTPARRAEGPAASTAAKETK